MYTHCQVKIENICKFHKNSKANQLIIMITRTKCQNLSDLCHVCATYGPSWNSFVLPGHFCLFTYFLLINTPKMKKRKCKQRKTDGKYESLTIFTQFINYLHTKSWCAIFVFCVTPF